MAKVYLVSDFEYSLNGNYCTLIGVYDNLGKAIEKCKSLWSTFDYEHDQRTEAPAIHEFELNKDYEYELW